jgi:hypothetical protein
MVSTREHAYIDPEDCIDGNGVFGRSGDAIFPRMKF